MESGLSKYIQQLLIQHECVIIPGFGAIISNPAPAFLEKQNKTIYPPYKKLAFNPTLKTNDGLLAHHLAGSENLSFEDALKQIRDEVLLWGKSLDEGQTLRLDDIGVFIQDQNKKLIFEPDHSRNYLLSSYGLGPVELSEVVRTRFTPETPEIELPEPEMGRTPVKKHYGRVVTYSLAGYLPVLLALWYFFMFREPFTANTAMSGIMIQNETETTGQELTAAIPATKEEVTVSEPATTNTVIESNDVALPLSSIQKDNHYFIIGGSFSKYDNALEYRNRLIQNNYQSEILNADNGNYRVTYGAFTEKEEAFEFLMKIRETANTEVWILKQ